MTTKLLQQFVDSNITYFEFGKLCQKNNYIYTNYDILKCKFNPNKITKIINCESFNEKLNNAVVKEIIYILIEMRNTKIKDLFDFYEPLEGDSTWGINLQIRILNRMKLITLNDMILINNLNTKKSSTNNDNIIIIGEEIEKSMKNL